MVMRKQTVGGTEIRIFGFQKDIAEVEESLGNAIKAFQYYEETIGLYPRKQLDIILTNGGMEYPGIVTVDGVSDPERLRYTLQHEIAHQWFYGVLSNDPYYDGYLDEGFAEFSTALLRLDLEGLSKKQSFLEATRWESDLRSNRKPSNLPANQYKSGTEVQSYLYAQPALKLWELFSKYDGIETAKAYLKAYNNAYAFKQVDTKEFIRFTKAYFLMEDDKFFESWLNF